ncbi:DUF3127 domain-containing protein [Spirosoma sordidisoli]|uniref:DUF3127 domain-containing protein n=1 Tax=Spirosoma sordidisoli TaxID=2502893 RepID=A0A4Q2UP68_9BACT|nr:DUF3127 domain-containing protein [Spirosoma sordidisoli]RYC69410.1 DUF3127 domain-containing protein [Spirosoma sordidisoli]
MALELIGKLVKVLPEVTGQGKNGPWNKQEFVIETLDSQYPKKVCLTAWGEKASDLKQFADGDTLKATFSAESREYNDRWYTELRAFRIELTEGDGAGAPAPGYAAPAGRPAQASRPAQPSQPAGMPFNTTFDDESNDLPF